MKPISWTTKTSLFKSKFWRKKSPKFCNIGMGMKHHGAQKHNIFKTVQKKIHIFCNLWNPSSNPIGFFHHGFNGFETHIMVHRNIIFSRLLKKKKIQIFCNLGNPSSNPIALFHHGFNGFHWPIVQKKKQKGLLTGNVAAPNSTIVTFVSPQALAIVSKPNIRCVIFGTGEEQIAFSVVFQKRQRPFMAFHQNRPHRSFFLSKGPINPTTDTEKENKGEKNEEENPLLSSSFLNHKNSTYFTGAQECTRRKRGCRDESQREIAERVRAERGVSF